MARKPIDLKYRNTTAQWVNKCAVLLLLCGLLPVGAVLGQSKTELESKRKKLLQDIEQTDNLLKKTAKSKEAAYNRFIALQQQIEHRASLVETVQAEIVAAQESITRTEDVVSSLNADIRTMEAEYGRMVRSAFRRKTLHKPLLYILSASSLNQAFRRWLFLRKYDAFRRQQSQAIRFTRDILSRRLSTLEQTRLEKELLLSTLTGQKSTLDTELVRKNNLLKELKQDEDRLRQQLKKQQAAHDELNKAIDAVITAEIKRKESEKRAASSKPAAKPAAAKKEKTEAKPTAPATKKESAAPETAVAAPDDLTSAAFGNQKGKLPMPVSKGFVSRKYGRQQHPTIRNLEITNNGIDIQTEEGAPARAVYEGIVAGVQFIPGHDYTVILQHGNYYTVYANLASLQVEKGQTVRVNETLGRVGTNPITGTAELHFEVWYQRERMNPGLWVK